MKVATTRVYALVILLNASSAWAQYDAETGMVQANADAAGVDGEQIVVNEADPSATLASDDPGNDRLALAQTDKLSLDEMGAIQAAADVGGALKVAFAIDRTVSIDGQIQAFSTLKWNNLSGVDGGTTGLTSLPDSVIASGGGTNIIFSQGANSLLTGVQNSANNKQIDVTTTMNIAVNSFSLSLQSRALDVLNTALSRGLR